MTEQEKGYRQGIRDAIEKWNNSDGFGSCFPEECVEPLHVLAEAFMAGYTRVDIEEEQTK